MSLQIEFGINDIEKANSLGALWDNAINTWYIPDKKKIKDYSNYIPKGSDIIVKTSFLIAVSTGVCWSCKQDTILIAIGAEQFLQGEYTDDVSEDKEWIFEKQLVLFSDVTYLPLFVANEITKRYKFYRHVFSENYGTEYWANHCIHCNTLQDDWSNHNQPGGAFFPCSREEAKVIDLIKINVKHDFPIIGGYALGDSNDLISKYSKRI